MSNILVLVWSILMLLHLTDNVSPESLYILPTSPIVQMVIETLLFLTDCSNRRPLKKPFSAYFVAEYGTERGTATLPVI